MSTVTQKHSVCRFCSNYCPVVVDVEDGKIIKIAGDPDNRLWGGYSCVRGRVQHLRMAHEDRLLHSQKRQSDGTYAPVPVEQAMDEIAAKLAELVEAHGAATIAGYNGTFQLSSSTQGVTFEAFMHALGSPMSFTPNTIDKPGKGVARTVLGNWMAPCTSFVEPEAVLLVGANPHASFSGFPNDAPAWLGESLRRGMKLIVVDPRETETARKATLHLQVRPGQDVAFLAAFLRVILEEELYDAEFVAENVDGLDRLRAAVGPFTPEFAGERCGVDSEAIVEAARLFAPTRRGFVLSGTGPNMAGNGSLIEYLSLAIDTVCGHWLREGDRVPVVPVFLPEREYKAQVAPLQPVRIEPQMRVRGLSTTPAGAPTGALPDEILLKGEGQIRALISCAGNPAAAWPDQPKAVAAMENLELLVQIDPWMSATAKLAHYVIAPKMFYEAPATTHLLDYYSGHVAGYGLTESYGAYTPALVDPPEGSDLIEEWEFFYGLAQRLGLTLELAQTFGLVTLASAGKMKARVPLDMSSKPTSDEVVAATCANARVPLDEVKRHPAGSTFPDPPVYVQPKDPGWPHRFQCGDPEMLALLAAVAAEEPAPVDPDYPFTLIPRRVRGMYNSTNNDGLSTRGMRHNPAYMNPEDIRYVGLEPGDFVDLESPWGRIVAIVEDDAGMRRGVIGMAHSYGDAIPAGDRDTYLVKGSNTSALMSNEHNFDPYSGQPQMGNIPVSVRRREERVPSRA
jgi:anaerobic selenocysteine-containing dehydrogenase